MGDVLQGAAALCSCKLACSLLFVPSLSSSHGPVGLCCCCLLIFTDALVTVFLSFLCVFQSWLPELTGDVIALRFLLFLGHTYGAVLLLVTPLIAGETLCRLLGPLPDGTAGPGGRRRPEAAGGSGAHKDEWLFHVVGYLCCLSVWVTVALNVMWRWTLEEVCPAACLHTTGSLLRCLPKLFSPVPVVGNPCWAVALLFLLPLLLTVNTGLHSRRQAPVPAEGTTKHGGEGLVPVEPGASASDPAQSVDPEKTQSSCSLHRAHFWNSVQMLARRHGDSVHISSGCLSVWRRGQKHGRTTVTLLAVEHGGPQGWGLHGRGLPCLGARVMIGLAGVLFIFVLPLNLSVNVLVLRTVESLLELCVKSLVSFASHTTEIPAFHHKMLV